MIEIDMKLPSCCDECFALDDHGDYPYCLISQDQRGYTFNARVNRMPSCPLKDNEPRVLTLEELQDWNDAVWFDELGEDEPFIALIYNYDITMAEISFVDTTKYRKLTSHDMRIYNKWWRCWTSKPTDEQREATPWKD